MATRERSGGSNSDRLCKELIGTETYPASAARCGAANAEPARWRCCRMASNAETWVIVGVDGKPIADIYGNVAVFTSRAEAERWLIPRERVQRRAASRASI